VNVHMDYVYKFGKNYRIVPAIDMFNVFNARTATQVYQQAMDQSASPDVRYGQEQDWQQGRRYRFGIRFQF